MPDPRLRFGPLRPAAVPDPVRSSPAVPRIIAPAQPG